MTEQQTNNVPVSISIQLMPSTIKRLEEINHYLAIRNKGDLTLEDTIKDAIANYLDVMRPLKKEEIDYIGTLVVDGSPYAIRNRFKEIMNQKGMKAVKLQKDTGISKSNISQVLNNKNLNMSLDYFLRIWFALQCPPIGDCLYRENLKP
ncbi:helix-turn-helix transcriptional regulator (plasmid) [Niallia sp. XMNu-256]|uniref:helix-turn-helix domain-containing protein n=1 Tax=Niallia sp. XMNu-256 TaxID=3082444 RepID=UPI0030D5F415